MNVIYHNRLNAEADMRIQLSSTKPYSKEICKNVKQCHSSHYILSGLENIVIFHKNLLFMLTCNELIFILK